MKSEGWKGFSFLFLQKIKWLFVGNAWNRKQFFVQYNEYFFWVVVRLEIWDGWEGQLKMPKFFFLFGGFLFLFVECDI